MTPRFLTLTSLAALVAGQAVADGAVLNRIASFPTVANMAAGEDAARTSSAEIIAASGDGMTLVYTDSPLGVVGFIDITDPAAPAPLGNLGIGGGEPVSVSVRDNTGFVAVDATGDMTAPAGFLLSVDLATQAELARCDLGGQPDSSAVAPDGSFVAVAIENQRDEEAGDGRVPQLPGGWVTVLPLANGLPDCDAQVRVDLTGIADIAPEDPEPEFVDVNAAGEIVVTLQENNHIAVIGGDGTLLRHFSAGAVDLTGVDLTEDGALSFTEDQPARLREPDGAHWIDETHFATANEGDMDGGARGFTIWNSDGTVVWESGAALEQAVAAIGHSPEARSDAKGIEPEGIEFAVMDGVPTLFILSERASVVAAYDVTDPAAPMLTQLLPSGVSPEGAIAIPSRGLLATANEADLGEDGLARAHVMIYGPGDAAAYPQIAADAGIGWAALGALTHADGMIHAASDSFFGAAPTIYTIDPAQTPARITAATVVTRNGAPAQLLDIEGIAADGAGGFWIASEGRTDRMIPHGLIHVGADGAIDTEIGLPPELSAHEIRFGAEGIALVGDTLWIAMQRPWGDDPEHTVKLVAYNVDSGEWGAVRYQTAAPAGEGWVGLSEIAVHGDHAYLIERDNQIGAAAAIKIITRVPLSEMVPAALGGDLPLVSREVVRDLMADLSAQGGFVVDKPEGLTILDDGTAWIVTDNDGVDDSSGETFFWSFPVE